MANERYIEKLQRERGELIDYARKVGAWKAALDHASVTGRKGTAYQEADRLRGLMTEAHNIIEPLLAEKEIA